MEPNADRNRIALAESRKADGRRPVRASGDHGQGRLGWLGRWLGGWPTDGWRRHDEWSGADSRVGGWLGAPDSYWRRRVFILCGGLVVLGLATWGLSALAGPVKPIAATQPDARTSLLAPNTLPPQAYGPPVTPTPSPSSPSPSASALVSPTSTATSTATATGATGTPSPSASGTASAKTSATPGVAPTCSPASMVLSLLTSQPAFSPGQVPTFNVYAVSTAPGTCKLAYGPSLVRVEVTRKGQVAWDSAACKSTAPAAKPVTFTQGVPQVVTLRWNRKASSPGCAGSASAGSWGTFDAVALSLGKSSPPRSFTLSR